MDFRVHQIVKYIIYRVFSYFTISCECQEDLTYSCFQESILLFWEQVLPARFARIWCCYHSELYRCPYGKKVKGIWYYVSI